ncbi:nucleoside/nucleotide kinase family protein [Actinotalea sp.]|uniref:nucleoside/nucleotide kinase family protein n=1 Tax=Actinotalea sp. TaxID=1872145 RepID=UPI003561F833
MSTPVERALTLAAQGRVLLGITGPPGAGKSTLAQAIVDGATAAGVESVLVPMDGFHLANAELERLGRRERKGAPDTFDAAGFVALLERIRRQGPADGPVYAPLFQRASEAALAGAVPVPPTARLVVVEGNYLLHDEGVWSGVLPLLDECWYVDLDESVRVERLIARHVAHGRSPQAAREWVMRSDEANARLVARGRDRATLRVAAMED